MAKYLPGGVWPMVGRSEMAVRGRLGRSLAYNSVALSMGAAYLCATLVSAALLPAVILSDDDLGGGLWVFVLIPIGLLVLHPAVLGKLFGLAERVLGGAEEQQVPPWTESVKLVLRHIPSWLCIGVSTWFVALTFDPNAPLLHVVFAGVLSWVTGFIVVFVPGGLGVRRGGLHRGGWGRPRPRDRRDRRGRLPARVHVRRRTRRRRRRRGPAPAGAAIR